MRNPDSLPPTKNEDTPQGLAYAMGAYVFWGFLPLYMKLLSHIPAAEVVAHRVIWSLPIAAVVLIILRRTDALREALRHDDEAVRKSAALGLAYNGDPAGVSLLAAPAPTSNNRRRRRGRQALDFQPFIASLGLGKSARDTLLGWLDHSDWRARIPALAAVLLVLGYKLARISLFQSMWRAGLDQFLPFIVTVVATVLTDLLTGVMLGAAVGVLMVLLTNYKSAIRVVVDAGGVSGATIELAGRVAAPVLGDHRADAHGVDGAVIAAALVHQQVVVARGQRQRESAAQALAAALVAREDRSRREVPVDGYLEDIGVDEHEPGIGHAGAIGARGLDVDRRRRAEREAEEVVWVGVRVEQRDHLALRSDHDDIGIHRMIHCASLGGRQGQRSTPPSQLRTSGNIAGLVG